MSRYRTIIKIIKIKRQLAAGLINYPTCKVRLLKSLSNDMLSAIYRLHLNDLIEYQTKGYFGKCKTMSASWPKTKKRIARRARRNAKKQRSK